MKQLQEAEEKEVEGVEVDGGGGKVERKKEVNIKHPAARGVFNALFKPTKWVLTLTCKPCNAS